MPKGDYPIPFSEGNLLSYTNEALQRYYNTTIEWRENTPFEATLTYSHFERGRSAAHLVFEDEQGHRYPMFLQQFDEIMAAGGFYGTQIHGEWVGVKRGENYGIQLRRVLSQETPKQQ